MACPTPEQLQQLLDETLPAADAQGVAKHVEGCTHCQQCLEKITSGAGTWNVTWERIARHLDSAPGPTEAEGNTPAGAATQDQHATSNDEVDLSFLAPAPQPGLLGVLDKYDIQAILGRGGFGIVFKAFDASLHRVVAIKVLAPAMASNGTARRRFIREARAAAAVTHENVVAIHEVSESGPIPYLVMQFVSGQTLHDKVGKSGPLGVKEILRIGMQIAEGLAAAHKQGLVHRDIKPANILLENGVERVKITDFGLARAVDDASISQSGIIAGTPMYMSPEQAHGQPVDHRSDLFSLGSVLYTMCTGRPPFRAESTMAVLKRVCEEEPRPIREVNNDIPDWLATIVVKLMAKNADDRFQTAKEVADLLGRHLAHLQEPSSSPMPSAIAAPRPAVAVQEPAFGDSWSGSLRFLLKLLFLQAIFAGPVLAGVLMPLMRAYQWPLATSMLVAAGFACALAIIAYTVAKRTSSGVRPLARGTGMLMTVACIGCVVVAFMEFIEPRHATLFLESRDPAMTLTLQDAQGNPLRQMVASTQLRLAPGSYTLLGHRDGKEVHREIVELQAGDHFMRSVAAPLALEPGWTPLFNGKDLTGWKPDKNKILGWKVQNGVLVGQETDQFLFSERGDFADFRLRIEAKINAAGNSGVFFRCPSTLAGGGYEAEIAAQGEPNLTGSLYAYPPRRILSGETRKLVRPDQWFVMEIEAVKGRLTVAVDGKVASDVADLSHTSGSLALQCFTRATTVQFRRIDIKEIQTTQKNEEKKDLALLVQIEEQEVARLQKLLTAEAIPARDRLVGEAKLLEAQIRLSETLQQPGEVARLGKLLVQKHEQIVDFLQARHEVGTIPLTEVNTARRQLLELRLRWPDEPAPAVRTGALQQLHQIGLAMHNYLDTHKAFPAQANSDKDGKPLLSWRVHLLPFLDQETLYRQFKLNEPWDSEHNQKLIAKMPAIYQSARSKLKQADGKTTFLVPVGPEMMFLGARQMKWADLARGSSNTILAVDADDREATIWTKPQDLVIDRKNPSRGLVRPDSKEIPTLFADGFARMLRTDLSAEDLWGYFQALDAAPKKPE